MWGVLGDTGCWWKQQTDIQTWHTGWNTEVTTKGLYILTNYKFKHILRS